MIGKMIINNTNRVILKNTLKITHKLNLSLEIGTRHIYTTDTHVTLLEDTHDGVDSRAQNGTNDTVNEDAKDRVEARAPNDDRNDKSQDIRHGKIHDLRSSYCSNCMNNLGNPSGIRPDN